MNSAYQRLWRRASPTTTIVLSWLFLSSSCAIASPQLTPVTFCLSGRAMPLTVDMAVRMPAKEPGPISTANDVTSLIDMAASLKSDGRALKTS